ncbi:uncharacterized protein LOC134853949 isoform X2 [Symsagittifera roscoffensis]|uniref:uncharacterized protein LOC134853949 isoform X2 n=1 Tax=Symsagittifera roscoffensis TaxID=84072 RepID=UPI00307CB518
MGCVSSNEVKESDPPIEKAETNNVQSIPKIEINGPSKSTSKENGIANHNAKPPLHSPEKAQEEPQTPQKQPATPKNTEKAPLFPHISPCRPQFNYKRDVALSPRSSKYLNDSSITQNGAAGDLSLDTSTWNGEHTGENDERGAAADHAEEIRKYKGDPTTPVKDRQDAHDKDSGVAVDDVHPVLKGGNIEQHVDNHEPEVNSGGDAVSSVAQKGTGEGEGKKEDRSAILAQFLAQQTLPEAGSSDEEDSSFHFAPKDHFDDDQTDDEPIANKEQPKHPLVTSDDKPASIDDNKKGKCAVDKYYGEDGKEVAFDADDRKKLNELLNEIEKIAEREGRFEKN